MRGRRKRPRSARGMLAAWPTARPRWGVGTIRPVERVVGCAPQFHSENTLEKTGAAAIKGDYELGSRPRQRSDCDRSIAASQHRSIAASRIPRTQYLSFSVPNLEFGFFYALNRDRMDPAQRFHPAFLLKAINRNRRSPRSYQTARAARELLNSLRLLPGSTGYPAFRDFVGLATSPPRGCGRRQTPSPSMKPRPLDGQSLLPCG
jgi:hypothetical protein